LNNKSDIKADKKEKKNYLPMYIQMPS